MNILQTIFYRTQRALRETRGFTLVETLVALTILTIAITGPLVLTSKSEISSRESAGQVVGFYLAQGAIEFIHNVRDTNFLIQEKVPSHNWLEKLEDCENGCIVESFVSEYLTDPEGITPCNGSCPTMNRNKVTGHYGYGSGTDWVPTSYMREVTITPSDDGNSISIEVFVSSDEDLTGDGVHIKQVFSNWKKD